MIIKIKEAANFIGSYKWDPHEIYEKFLVSLK